MQTYYKSNVMNAKSHPFTLEYNKVNLLHITLTGYLQSSFSYSTFTRLFPYISRISFIYVLSSSISLKLTIVSLIYVRPYSYSDFLI
jgi:hypothetical protein